MKKYFKLLSLVILVTVIFSLSVFDVFADGNLSWGGNGSDANLCTGNYAGQTHWIFSPGGNDSVTAATLKIGNSTYSMTNNGQGGSWSVYVAGGKPASASVDYVGSLGNGNPVLTISCLGTSTPTCTPTPTITPTVTPTVTPTLTPTPTVTPNVTPPPTHLACVENACTIVSGAGDNECTTDPDSCETVTVTPTVTPTPTPTETPTVTPTPTPTQSVQGTSTGGDGRSDGLSSCPECTQPPHTQAVLGASTSVLGLSATGGNENVALQLFQFLGVVALTTTGFVFYRKNS